MRTCIQRDQTSFYHIRILFHCQWVIHQLHSKTQGAIVQNFLRSIAIGINNLVINHQGSRTATQCRSHFIAIQPITMIYMIRNRAVKLTRCFRIRLLQLIDLRFSFRIQFACITGLYNRFRCVVFGPYIIAESTFAGSLQSRAISTESNQVILPCHIIHTFGIIASACLRIENSRHTCLNSISGSPVCLYRGRENHFLIISNLIRYLLPVSIEYNNLCRIGQLQFRSNITHGYLHHFTGTLHSSWVRYRYSNRFALITSETYKSSCNKEK